LERKAASPHIHWDIEHGSAASSPLHDLHESAYDHTSVQQDDGISIAAAYDISFEYQMQVSLIESHI
jgi:hypothetical protein